jgi:pectin methylesterase-like acyl-CoA thioesterase
MFGYKGLKGHFHGNPERSSTMKISGRVMSFLILLNFAIFCGTSNAAFLNRDVCTSGCPYSSLQEAINAADDGDTIRVAQGRYFENIVINNPITLTILGGWSQDFLTRSNDPPLPDRWSGVGKRLSYMLDQRGLH